VAAFSPLLDMLAEVPDPRRAEGKLYQLPHVLLFSILAIVTGCNSYRGIVTFIEVHRRKLNTAFGLKWRRAPAHTAIRYILQGLDPTAVETVFRRHACLLQAALAKAGPGSIALDGKTLRGSFDKFHDRTAHIEGRIAFLKAELAITDAQTTQWDSYAAAMRTNSKGMQDAMAKIMQAGMPTTAPGRADTMIQMITARLDGMKSSAEAEKALYAVLTETQRKVADDLMPGPMGIM